MHSMLTPEQRQEITNVAVAGHLPMWFFTHRLSLRELPEDRVAREALIEGLELLASGRSD